MSRKTVATGDWTCVNVPAIRLKIFPLPVVYQKRSGPWYSIAVMSSVVPLAIGVQIAADAGPAAAPTPSAASAPVNSIRTARDTVVPPCVRDLTARDVRGPCGKSTSGSPDARRAPPIPSLSSPCRVRLP